jgi:septum site-determining protein MinC
MAETKHRVTIKGVKDGLIFWIDDRCPFSEAMKELEHKLDKTHRHFLAGPVINVRVKLGSRTAGPSEMEKIREIIGRRGNLILQGIDSDAAVPSPANNSGITVITGIVRSGQTVRHDGDLLFLGDVNPGGAIVSTGDIYVLGALRGIAHAGAEGKTEAIIAASFMRPTQLRIAEIFSRPPDEWGIADAVMEFAYIRDGKMQIDKISQLYRLRPDHPLQR